MTEAHADYPVFGRERQHVKALEQAAGSHTISDLDWWLGHARMMGATIRETADVLLDWCVRHA